MRDRGEEGRGGKVQETKGRKGGRVQGTEGRKGGSSDELRREGIGYLQQANLFMFLSCSELFWRKENYRKIQK